MVWLSVLEPVVLFILAWILRIVLQWTGKAEVLEVVLKHVLNAAVSLSLHSKWWRWGPSAAIIGAFKCHFVYSVFARDHLVVQRNFPRHQPALLCWFLLIPVRCEVIDDLCTWSISLHWLDWYGISFYRALHFGTAFVGFRNRSGPRFAKDSLALVKLVFNLWVENLVLDFCAFQNGALHGAI